MKQNEYPLTLNSFCLTKICKVTARLTFFKAISNNMKKLVVLNLSRGRHEQDNVV